MHVTLNREGCLWGIRLIGTPSENTNLVDGAWGRPLLSRLRSRGGWGRRLLGLLLESKGKGRSGDQRKVRPGSASTAQRLSRAREGLSTETSAQGELKITHHQHTGPKGPPVLLLSPRKAQGAGRRPPRAWPRPRTGDQRRTSSLWLPL